MEDKTKLLGLKIEIEKMSVNNQLQIFNIIKDNNGDYTKHKNGVFIRLNKLPPKIIDDIENRIQHIYKIDINR